MQSSEPLKRALNYLETRISHVDSPQGTRLPSIKQLAKDAGVATAAMYTAITTLVKKGLLSIEGKRGIFVGKHVPGFSPAPESLKGWKKIRQSLEHDILLGLFEDQESLPGIHELQKHYPVSLPTLRKALGSLVADGALAIKKRKYHIVRIKRPVQFTSILLISPGVSLTEPKTSGTFIEFHQTLQSRCFRNNIHMAYSGVTDKNMSEALDYLHKHKEFFGYALFASGMEPDATSAILHMLAGRGRPVAIVDEGGGYPLPVLKSPSIVFTAASFLAGRQMGKFLRELGHKHVAFVTLHHDEPWSQKRYTGLCQAFSETGAPGGVKLVSIQPPDDALVRDDPEMLRNVEKRAGITEDFAWRKSIPAQEFTDTINRMFRYLSNLRSMHAATVSHFTDLLQDTSITAIIGSQDFMAVLAHEFLKQRNIAVPDKISLCGFDNARMAIVDDLTTYNFLFSNIATDVLAYIINPKASAFAGRREIECSGTILQRATTGPARPIKTS